MPTNVRPRVSTVVSASGVPSSRERQPYVRLAVTEAQLTGGGGHVDAKLLARVLGQVQDNAHAGTLAARSNPLGSPYIAEGVAMDTSKGTVGAVTSEGTTPPTLTLSGSPLGTFSFVIDITTGGSPGTAAFQWSSDGGHTWAGKGIVIRADASGNAAAVSLGGTGILALWTTATPSFTVDNVYTATASVPPVVIRHGLGEAVAHWDDVRTYAGSHPFAAAEVELGSADWPASKYPPSQYLLLYPGCTGTYNLALHGS